MPQITVVTEAQLRDVMNLDLSVVDCVSDAFVALATQPVVMPPILRMDMEDVHGEVDVKTAYVPGLDSFAIKISPGFFDNPKRGLPSVNGMMVLFSAHTGLVEAVLLDNGYLTDLRTAAAGAVAARELSRADATRVTIFGAGTQARLQLQALTLVRPIASARIWARDPDRAEEAAFALRQSLSLPVTAENDPEAAVADADIIVTTTPSTQPILMADWLRPGQHITAMGSDSETKNELDPQILRQAGLYVGDSQTQVVRLGEARQAIQQGIIPADMLIPELGQVIAGQKPGRTDADQLTVCDLTGTGVQDTAIATLARRRLAESGAGTIIES